MWFFSKNKNKDNNKNKGGRDAGPTSSAQPAVAPAAPLTSKQEKTRALMAQMRALRAEIGEETLQKLADKLRLDALKEQIRSDIDNNPGKRDRLLDEIRLHVRDDDASR